MKKLSLSLSILGLWGSQLAAQSDLSLYNFNAVPQSLHTNPAYPQQAKLWIALPVIGGVSASYHNSGFALIDLFEKGTEINENVDNLINRLDSKSHLAVHEETDLLGIGFRTKAKGFISFGARQVFDYRMDYPVDLLKLVRFGNADVEFRNTNLSTFDYEVMSRLNFYVGYQKTFLKEKLRLGGRFKYIIGQAHTYAERTEASIETLDNSSLRVSTDILIRTAGVAPFADNTPFNFSSSVFPKNNGFALDLGGHYKMNDRWDFSASVLDLGLINWKGNTREYASNGSFTYEGFNADLSKEKPVESFEDIKDSLKAAFEFTETDGNAYSRALASRVFLAANYNFNDKHSVGAIYHARIWEKELFHDVSLNYQARLSRTFQYSLSYSVVNGIYNNVGAGLSLKLGAIQIYALSDNLLHALMYENLQNSSLRVGINLTFFGKKEKETKTPQVPPAPAKNPSNK